jgi:hypothetical protein
MIESLFLKGLEVLGESELFVQIQGAFVPRSPDSPSLFTQPDSLKL